MTSSTLTQENSYFYRILQFLDGLSSACAGWWNRRYV